MVHGLHHFHKRKRIYEKHEPYPHPNKWIRLMDKLVYVGGVSGPVMTVPQLMKIWVEKNASSISLISWTAFLFGAIFWFVYGIIHKEKPLIFIYGIWIILHSFIIIGTLMYS